MNLTTTLIVLACQLAIIGYCLWQDRKPVNPAKPRLLPYRLIMLIMLIISLATLAHAIALWTGQPVVPRRKMGT